MVGKGHIWPSPIHWLWMEETNGELSGRERKWIKGFEERLLSYRIPAVAHTVEMSSHTECEGYEVRF